MRLLAARSGHLAVLRIVVFSLWFGLILTTDTSIYAALPEAFSNPRGLGEVLGVSFAVQYPTLLAGLKVAALTGCALCVVGVRPYWLISAATALLILFHDAAMKSFGSYSNHAQVVPLLLVLMLPFFPAADAAGLPPRRASRDPWLYRVPIISAAVVLCLTYAFIGARRLFLGGVGIYTDESMLRWVVARSLEYGAHDVSLGLAVMEHGWLLPALGVGLLVTTAFEILSPLALRYRRFSVMWVLVVGTFHLSTLLLMNIFFWENLVLLIVLFTPLGDWLAERLVSTAPVGTAGQQRGVAGEVSP